jgi:hypothetical protein
VAQFFPSRSLHGCFISSAQEREKQAPCAPGSPIAWKHNPTRDKLHPAAASLLYQVVLSPIVTCHAVQKLRMAKNSDKNKGWNITLPTFGTLVANYLKQSQTALLCPHPYCKH